MVVLKPWRALLVFHAPSSLGFLGLDTSMALTMFTPAWRWPV